MDELKRILALPPEERSDADLEYLIAHEKDLTADQKTQLEMETKELSDDNILEEYTAEFVTKGLDKIERVSANTPIEKTIGKKVIRYFSATVKDLGDGMMEAIVASQAEDRHGEMIDMRGMDIKRYMANPIISNMHDWSKPSVGRTHKLTKQKDGKLKALFEWAIKGELKNIHEQARLLYELYKEGFQFAFSIEFIPHEYEGTTYTKSEMIGFAPVVVPANPEALILAKKKGLDNVLLKTYNIRDMYELSEILKKAIDELTLGEIKFLKENKDKLTVEQAKQFASVLEEKAADPKDATLEAVKSLTETVKTLATDVAEIKNADPVQVKDIAGQNDPANKNININKNKEVSKELKFLYYARGLQTKDFTEYLNVVGKDAMNTSGNVVVPPQEFVQEIERLEEQYGVARQFANVRRMTSGAGVKYVMGDDDLEIFDTAESGVKKSTKLTYKQLLLTWRKFAGILPITDELTEDSAVDLWNDATQRFARAYTKKEDQLVITNQAAGGNTKDGIIHVAGTKIVTAAGDSVADITADDFYDMVYGVPSQSAQNGRFLLNRELLGIAAKLKDDEGRPLWQASIAQGVPPTIAGKPYTETEVLPGVDEDDADTAFAVFGDLRYTTLAERTDLNIKIFDAGTVGDPDEEDQDANTLNLLTQDIQAMRAVKRMNAVVRFPEAFSVLKTAGNS